VSIAALQNRSRLALHEKMKRPVSVYDKSGVLVGLSYARRKTDTKAVGDLAGTNLSYAEVQEPVSSLIFLLTEHVPERGETMVFSATEGYYLDVLDPIDGLTQTVQVSRMTSVELTRTTPPEDL
jgi:hypothetical protein